jgi:hypothetical protein
MSAPRRRIVRPQAASPPSDQAEQRRMQRLRARLRQQRDALERWWKRLRRALNAVEKHHRAVKNLERQLAQPGDNANGQAD